MLLSLICKLSIYYYSFLMYLDDPELQKKKAEATKQKWDKIISSGKPFLCKFCGIKKKPEDFVVDKVNNYWVGKYRYLYECRECKKARIYKKRHQARETLAGALGVVYKQIKQGAKQRKLEFTLSLGDIEALWEQQKGLCYFTWYPMGYESIVLKPEKQSEKTKYQVSCDRLNPSIWYVQGNVVLCCSVVNRMKNILSEEEFYTVCKDIIKNRT